MTNQDPHPACNCYDCNPQKQEAYGTHTTANQSKINLEPYRLECVALEAVERFFTNTHQRILGNMTLDAISDNCFNLPEVVAYIDATSWRDSKVTLVSTVGWTPIAKKYIRERISYEIRKFINNGK